MKSMHLTPMAAVLLGGFIAGTIDIGAASLINWLSPIVILRAIASGLLGKAAFHEGVPAALLGLGLQWAMGILIAAIYMLGTYRFTRLRQRWIPMGVGYGAVILIVMNYVVVPLSAAPFKPSSDMLKIAENLLAMILFGLIVAFFAQRAVAATSMSTSAEGSV
ncbi:MAG: hypothetical protein ACRER0_00565 [Gammaproteobacteria bacterium]